VLLLDQAQWRIDDGEWQPREEILRLDNLVRAKLHLPPRWRTDRSAAVDRPRRGTRADDVAVEVRRPQRRVRRPAAIALEDADAVTIDLDGIRVAQRSDRLVGGTRRSARFRCRRSPPGRHELVVTIPFTRKTSVEACYLLGDFGVIVAGRDTRIVQAVRRAVLRDWTSQGLPFYGGSVTYHCTITGDGESGLQVEGKQVQKPAAVSRPRRLADRQDRLRAVPARPRSCAARRAPVGHHRVRQPRQHFRSASTTPTR
jgi:hypothetical protein